MLRTGVVSSIGVKKSPVNSSAPNVSIALNDLGNGAVDTGAGASVGVGAASFTRATNAACRLANGNWKLDVANNVARSHYLLGTVPAYVATNGLTGNYASTPNTAVNVLTGDIDIIVFAALDNYAASQQCLMAKWVSGVQCSWVYGIDSGFFVFYGSVLGTAVAAVGVSLPALTAYQVYGFRVTREKSTGLVTFYYSTDGGGSWIQRGASQINSPGLSLFSNTANVLVGAIDSGTAWMLKGKVYSANLYNGINGSLVNSFNAARAANIGATSFVASTGETWTINGLAYIGADTVYGGYLHEAASTQLLTNGRDLSQPAWVKTNVNITFASGIDGGSNNSSVLTASLANGTCLQTFVAAASSRTFSAFVKRVIGTGIIEITQDGGATWTPITSQINGGMWLQVQLNASVLNASFGFRIQTSGDAIGVDCCQFEAGDCATTVIPGAGTRNNDILAYAFTPITQGVGTLYCELSAVSIINPPTPKVINAGLDNGAANNIWNRIIFNSQQVDLIGNNAGPQWDAVGRIAGIISDKTYQTAQAYSLNSIGACVTGIAVEAIGAGTPPTDINRITFAISANASACIKNMRIWPTRLLNSQVQQLTNP